MDRISAPKIVLLALGAAAVLVLCILAIIGTDAVWIALLTALAIALIGLAIAAEMRGVISRTGDEDASVAPTPPPGRAVVMCTGPMTAEQVLGALGPTEHRSIMFVAPEGLGGRGLMVDERDYARALQAETATVAALRRAGLNAAGHVGDRNPAHAIVDALALFPAGQVVIVARADELEFYRRHVDGEELKRRTGADVRVREVVGI